MDRLLFVDDEPFVLKALKRTFELEGYEVVTATRPAEALEILGQGHQFVVIGSDYRMPEMDGAKFLQQAREIAPQSYRLLISAVEEFQAAVDAVNRGEIFRFIPKPWNHGDLLQIVRSAVDEYHLRRNYQEMTTLLHSKNSALESLNLSLERRVHQRTPNPTDGLGAALAQRGPEKHQPIPAPASSTSPRRTRRSPIRAPSAIRVARRRRARRSSAARERSSIPLSPTPSPPFRSKSGTRWAATRSRRPARPSRRSRKSAA